MADDISKKYLDEEGLKTYDEQIKEYISNDFLIDANRIAFNTLSVARLPIVPVLKGGTGATDTTAARNNLDVYSKTEVDELVNSVSSGNNTALSGYVDKTTYNNYVSTNSTKVSKLSTSITQLEDCLNSFTTDDIIGGTLPVERGGTGVSNLGSEGAVLLAGTDGNQIKTACADYFGGAFYCSQGSKTPQFGTLPIAYGGTGALNADRARSNLGIITGIIQDALDENSAAEIELPTSARFCIATICGCHKNATSLLQQNSDVMHHTEKLHLSVSYNDDGKRVIIIKPHLDQKDAIPGYYVLVNYLYIDE